MPRPSTSASIMQQGAAAKFRPAPVLQSGRMTLKDLQKLSSAAVSNSQAIASNAAKGSSQAAVAESVAPVEMAPSAPVAITL